jgi:hypothetical protein
MMASLAVGGVLLLAMIAASARGAVRIAPDARIGVHCGSVEHCFFVSKRAGLIIWPAIGAVLFVVLGGITKSSLAAGWVPGVQDVLGPAVLFVVFGFQVRALVLAGRGAGLAAAAGGAGTKPDRETTARSD